MAAALPELTDTNRFFWTSGADGRLRVQRCNHCSQWIHPPAALCPFCLDRGVAPQEVSGFATIEAVTVNYQPWTPGDVVPYAIARVSIDEDPAVRMTTRIICSDPEKVAIGQRVKVRFEQRDDVYLPFFESA